MIFLKELFEIITGASLGLIMSSLLCHILSIVESCLLRKQMFVILQITPLSTLDRVNLQYVLRKLEKETNDIIA